MFAARPSTVPSSVASPASTGTLSSSVEAGVAIRFSAITTPAVTRRRPWTCTIDGAAFSTASLISVESAFQLFMCSR